MKIAMLTNNYRPFVGGVPVSVERQAQELTRLGHQVTVIAPMYGDDEEERSRVLEQDERSPERVVRYRTQKMKMPNGMVYPSFRPEEVFGIFERETFDCIHVHHPVFAGIWALSLGKKYDIPVIYTYHTRYEDYLHYIPFFREKEERRHIRNRFTDWVKGSVIPSYMKWFCSQCDLVVAPSAGMLQDWMPLFTGAMPGGQRRSGNSTQKAGNTFWSRYPDWSGRRITGSFSAGSQRSGSGWVMISMC